MKNGSRNYPVHYSKSDTSGEKAYEEFFTKSETIDLNRFSSLGVITNKAIPDKGKVVELIRKLVEAFDRKDVTKNDIVYIIKQYLPNFDHIETGKSLDSKM